MAIVSENMLYQEKIAPSYVSWSGYYGYVPPTCPFVNYESVVVKQPCNSANEAIDAKTNIAVEAASGSGADWTVPDSTFIFHNDNNHNDDTIRKYGSAMEIDQDETLRGDESRTGISRCQNNRCVIPEAGVQRANDVSTLFARCGYESLYRAIEKPQVNSALERRGNRKRNSDGDPAYLIDDRSANSTKKLRQGSSRKSGSSTVHYEQRSLIEFEKKESTKTTDFADSETRRCRKKAASNHDSFVRTRNECLRGFVKTSKDSKFGADRSDYEIMLMETHGCSAYHYACYRNAVSAETEF